MPETDLRDIARGEAEPNVAPGFVAQGEPESLGSDDRPNTPASLEIVGAIGLSITTTAFILFAGSITDSFLIDSDEPVAGLFVGAVGALVGTLALIRITELPPALTIAMVSAAAVADVAIHLATDGATTNVLGLTPRFIESAILSGVLFGIAWLFVVRKHGRPLSDLGFVAPKSPAAFLLAMAAWFVALIGVGIYTIATSDVEAISPPDNTTPVLEVAGGSLIVAWLLVGLWGPAVEEIFFRGYLLGQIRSRIGYLPALLVSSGIFALFHIQPGLYVPTFLLGLAFGWVYLKTNSIWPPMFAHMLHNSLAIFTAWQDSQ